MLIRLYPFGKSAIRQFCWLIVVCFTIFAFGQETPASQPLSQREACSRFSDAVVSIASEADDGQGAVGSGFVVSSDGYVMTANHVVRDERRGRYYETIKVTLPDGTSEVAAPSAPLTIEDVGKDFVVLKIDAKSRLNFLPLGSIENAVNGADATIIGFPFSAFSHEGRQLSQKLCLSASIAAHSKETVPVAQVVRSFNGMTKQFVNQDVRNEVQVDVIYFEGPSIKGLSGSPVISRDSGLVIGILSARLTGIDAGLETARDEIIAGGTPGVLTMGAGGHAINDTQLFLDTINTLDSQLANGLGSAVGIDEPKKQLEQVSRAPSKTDHSPRPSTTN